MLKGADTAMVDGAKSKESLDNKLGQLEEKFAKIQQEMAGDRRVHDEVMQMYRQQTPPDLAMQIAKRQEAQLKRVQIDTVGTMLHSQQELTAEMVTWRAFYSQARKIFNQNNGFQNMGGQ